MKFDEHKEVTASDCEAVASMLIELSDKVRSGDMRAFEAFWIEGGTEEGDAKVDFIREMLILRFYHREKAVRFN